MKKSIKLGQVILLSIEIQGIQRRELDMEMSLQNPYILQMDGLLNEKIDYPIKLRLKILNNEVQSHIQSYVDLRSELIKRYGEQSENGSYSISAYLDKEGKLPNENWKIFSNERDKILSQEIEVSIPKIDMNEINFKSKFNYDMFDRYVLGVFDQDDSEATIIKEIENA